VSFLLSKGQSWLCNALRLKVAFMCLMGLFNVACEKMQPHALLTIEDPLKVAGGHIKFAIGGYLHELETVDLSAEFPVTLTMVSETKGERTLWVEARGQNGEVLGRGITTINFKRQKPETKNIELYAVCKSDASSDGQPCLNVNYPYDVRVCHQATCKVASCGDGDLCSTQACDSGAGGGAEECDDGMHCDAGEACNVDGQCAEGETCAVRDGDGCLNDCRKAVCGDGVVRRDAQGLLPAELESCVNDSDCTNEEHCYSDGFCYPSGYEECDLAGANGGLSCSVDCLENICGDGVQNTDLDDTGEMLEACDDGNENPNDGCDGCAFTTWTIDDALVLGAPSLPIDVDLKSPKSMAIDLTGSLYVADALERRIWQFRPAEETYTARVWAGTGKSGYGGDGNQALLAEFIEPVSLALDQQANLYIADRGANCIRKIDVFGFITTFAGECGQSPDTSTASYTGDPLGLVFHQVQALAVSGENTLLIADTDLIRKIDLETNTITTVLDLRAADCSACGDALCDALYEMDSLGATDQAIAVDASGTIVLSDAAERRLFKVGEVGAGCDLSVYAGTGESCHPTSNCGDNGLATSAQFNRPGEIIWKSAGLIVSDTGLNRIREINTNGMITTFAGNGTTCLWTNDETCAEGLSYTNAISAPLGLALDNAGSLYVSEYGQGLVQKLKADDGLVERIAGTANVGGIGSSPLSVDLEQPGQMVYNASDKKIYFADTAHHRILAYSKPTSLTTGGLELVAGSGVPCLTPEHIEACGDGEATSAFPSMAKLNLPGSLVLDEDNNTLYFSDLGTFRIRKVDLQGRFVESVIGTGVQCEGVFENPDPCLRGKAVENARLLAPRGLALDAQGALYFVEPDRHQIFRTSMDEGVFTNIERISADACEGDSLGDNLYAEGGSYTDCLGAEQTPLNKIHFNRPYDLAFHTNGDLFVADRGNYLIRRIDAVESDCSTNACTISPETSTVTDVAGTGTVCTEETGTCGDGGTPTEAELIDPQGIDLLYVNESIFKVVIAEGARIRLFDSDSAKMQGIAGTGVHGFSGDFMTNATDAMFESASDVLVADGQIFVTDREANVLRQLSRKDSEFVLWTAETVVGNVLGYTGSLAQSRVISPASVIGFGPSEASRRFFLSDAYQGRIMTLTLLHGPDAAAVDETLTTFVGYRGGFTLEDEAAADIPAAEGRLLSSPRGLAYDEELEALYLSETYGHTIRCVDLSQDDAPITTIAGVFGEADYSSTNAAPLSSHLNEPMGLAFEVGDTWRTLYIADKGNHVIRKLPLSLTEPCVVAESSTLELYAGHSQTPGIVDDSGQFLDTYFYGPEAVALNKNGELYVADTQNHRVRRLYYDGAEQAIETVVGIGLPGQGGAGIPASNFQVESPNFLVVDAYENLWISSTRSLSVVTSGVDEVARGEDAFLTVYGQPPRQDFPMDETQCLSGFVLYTDTQDDDSALLLDSCLGYVMNLSR
jgi:sugar lactone lactonase YvrE